MFFLNKIFNILQNKHTVNNINIYFLLLIFEVLVRFFILIYFPSLFCSPIYSKPCLDDPGFIARARVLSEPLYQKLLMPRLEPSDKRRLPSNTK